MAVMLTPTATRFVGPLSFAALSRHPVETDVLELLPDGRIGHIVLGDTADVDRRRAGDGALAGRDGQRPGRRRRDRDLPRDVGPGRRRARRWTATCGPTRRRSPTSTGCAGSATRSSSPRRGRSRRGSPASGGWPSSRAIVDAVVAAVDDRPVRAAGPGGAAAARRAGPRRGPRRPPHRRHRRRHARGDRPGPLHRQSLDRADGRRRRRGRARPRRPGHAHRRERRGAAAARRDDRPGRVDRRPRAPRCCGSIHAPDGSAGFDALVMAAAVADFRPVDAAPTKLARADGLTLRLESTPDLLEPRSPGSPAGSTAMARRRANRSGRARSSSGSRPRPGRSSAPPEKLAPQGRRPARRQRRRRGRAPASAPTPTGSRSSPPTARARTCRSSRSGRSPTGCSTGSPPRWTSATPPRRLAARPSPSGSQHERHRRDRPPPDRRRHRPHVRRRHADRDADRLRLPDRAAARRGRHPDAPRRRFARPGDPRLRDDGAGHDGRDGPPHQGRRARHVSAP